MITFLNQSKMSQDIDNAVIGTIEDLNFSESFGTGSHVIPRGDMAIQKMIEHSDCGVFTDAIGVLRSIASIVRYTDVIAVCS